jgi:hypothetical protein
MHPSLFVFFSLPKRRHRLQDAPCDVVRSIDCQHLSLRLHLRAGIQRQHFAGRFTQSLLQNIDTLFACLGQETKTFKFTNKSFYLQFLSKPASHHALFPNRRYRPSIP